MPPAPAGPPPPSLESTVGVWLVCSFVAAILQGAGMLQAFLYFVWYPKDPWTVKATVIILVILQCIQMGGAIANIYVWFITGFGDFDGLNTIHMQDMLQLVALFLSIFVAQMHFARSIFQLMKKNWIIPVLIVLFAMASLGAGLGQVIIAIGLKHYSNLAATRITSNLEAAFALTADVLITVGLCWRLNQGKSGMQSTNRVLNFLIMTAINRGVVTMCFAVINIALFVTTPGTLYFMIGILISDKLYMNSLLAILNTREYASHLRGGMEVSSSHNRPPVSFNAPPRAGVSVVTVREDYLDMNDYGHKPHRNDF